MAERRTVELFDSSRNLHWERTRYGGENEANSNLGAPDVGDGNCETKKRENPSGFFGSKPRKEREYLSPTPPALALGTHCMKKCRENEGPDARARIREVNFQRTRSLRACSFTCKRTSPLQKLFLFIAIMGSLPGIDPSVLSSTICKYLQYKNECERDIQSSLQSLNQSKRYCEGEFDNYMCWTHAEAGKMTTAPCPDFYGLVNKTKVGYRYCQPNGSWYQAYDANVGKVVSWRHIEDCNPFDSEENETTLPEANEVEVTLLKNLRLMYTVGYGVSLVCLVIALVLLAFFKKLHCTRNYIHMNLMVSFILRYVVILIKDTVLLSHYQLDGLAEVGHLNHEQLSQYCDEDSSGGWVLTRCRLVITLMHYVITANYFWLLAEGLYLQMLLVFVMSENKHFAGFMVFGWGAPWISVIIWVVLRMQLENNGCWDMNDKLHIWWTIKAPIIISIVINFFIFINIVRLIVSKLQAHNMAKTDVKLRLAKSTLALIPLLGIHYIVFLALTEEVTETNTTPMHLRLAFDMFLSSIQGTLVSILYCFLNNEVRTEVRRVCDLWRSHKNLPKGSNYRKGSTSVSGNHSTQITQLYSRHSTNGADISAHENYQPPNSIDSRHNSIETRHNGFNSSGTQALKNGNGITIDAKNEKIHCDVSDLNGNAKVKEYNSIADAMAVEMPEADGNGRNGDVVYKDDEPFLRGSVI